MGSSGCASGRVGRGCAGRAVGNGAPVQADGTAVFTVMNMVRYGGPMTSRRGPDSAGATSAPSVGVIGLGVMGRPMTLNVLRRRPDLAVHVTARDPRSAAAVVDGGARWHPTARDVATAADVVVVVVPDMPAIHDVLAGPDGLLAGVSRPTVLCLSSTVSPDAVRRLDEEVREATAGLLHVVDAPVSGGEEGAVAGTLSVMVGGADDDVARVLGVYRAVGTPVHLGPLGAGQVAKACNQIIVAAQVLALGEAAVIAERAGLDVGQMFDLLGGGYAGSRILEVKKRRFAEHDHSPSGPARFMIKDLGAATEEARRTGTATPQTDLLLRVFADLTQRGYGDQDTAVVQAYLESLEREDPTPS
jgi:2-hydroxy-3-oxopropionate reductase